MRPSFLGSLCGKRLELCAALLLFAVPAQAGTPPINCRAARSPVDRTICASPESVALDQEITGLYNRGLARLTGEDRHRVAQSQRAYVHRRAGCDWASHHSAHPGPAVTECVRGIMDDRLHALRRMMDKDGT